MGAKQLSYSDEARQKLLAGVTKLARAVCCTLGPRGRNAVIDNMKALKKAFPKSVAMQYANFMPEAIGTDKPVNLRTIYEKAAELHVAMGGPDLLPYRPYQMLNSYSLINQFSSRITTGIAVQDGNYNATNSKTGKKVTFAEMIDFATNYLHVNYMFWGTEEPYYKRDVIPYFKSDGNVAH